MMAMTGNTDGARKGGKAGRAGPSLKARALRYLSAREHSRAELARKLARYAEEGDDVNAVLDSLEAAKFLSDQRFVENLVHRRAGRFGNSRILAELHQHQIDAETLLELKNRLSNEDPTDESADNTMNETARALEVWRKKFGAVAQDAHERARQIRFLAQRGFSSRSIGAVLRADVEE